MKATNIELWNAARAKSVAFKGHTAEGTKELFSERGFEALAASDRRALDEYYQLSLTFILNKIDRPNLGSDPLEAGGFGESYETPYGAYVQRMAVNMIKPVTPKYTAENFVNGTEQPNPFITVKGEVKERFFDKNFNYQALLTIPDDYMYKQIFTMETGMFDFISAIQEQLENAYKVQKYVNKKEAINEGILHAVKYPLQATQTVEVEGINQTAGTYTEDGLKNLILSVNNTIEALKSSYVTSAFNAMKYKNHQDVSRLKLLLKTGIANEMKVKLLASAFHLEQLGFDVEVITVPDFGGLTPKHENTTVYPVYNTIGQVIGYSETDGATEATYTEDEIEYTDPNADVIGILADKGVLFETTQREYMVESIRNPRTLSTNFWASKPNASISIDPLYTVVVFKEAA